MTTEKLNPEGGAPNCSGYSLKDPHFWTEAWNGAHRNSLSARRRRDLDTMDYWNRLAGRFERWAGQERTGRRVARVLSWLEGQGVLQPGMDVLDIGAGTGVFTVPLARRGAKVTALEPAPAMLAALQKMVEAQGLTNVHFLDREWEKVDPVQEGLAGRFDVVFASLTPGVRDVETLEKMITCSRRWCFLCDYAGRRSAPGREELWRLLFSEEMPTPGHDIIYPLNYLYASGYRLSFQTWEDDWGEELPVAEAAAGLEEFFRLYTEVTPEIKKTIARYVEQRAVNGVYREEYRVRLGMILWTGGEKWEAETGAV
ncbi:MAG TPA: class I SAM-dependent methyltransferase [Syntrophomonadaceae bacterium]|nr:class I SAM-dependent methyltransferase [Syntrophomonadaceae bacterium]